jgi:hypothetical protein
MKKSEIKEKAWHDAVLAAESKKISEWVDVLRESGCTNISITSLENFGSPTTIISDADDGDAYIMVTDHSAPGMDAAIAYLHLSRDVTQTISELYLLSQANK